MKKLILSLIVTVTLSFGARVEDAQIAFDKKDFDTAIKIAKPLANQGDMKAIVILTQIYSSQTTYGSIRDHKKAIYWSGKLLDRSKNTELYKEVLYIIGDLYNYSGYKNYNKALEYFEKACKNNKKEGCTSYQRLKKENIKFEEYQKLANQGNAKAQEEIGFMYQQGEGVQKDLKKANYWYEKAANQGLELAQNWLGINYLYGWGIQKDLKKAIYWCEKSANQGDIIRQKELGDIYYYRWGGIQKDFKKAIYWYEKAAVQYDDSSKPSSYKNLTALIAVARMMDIYSNDDFEEKNLEKAFSFYKIICNSRSLDDTINTSCERMKKIANQISNPEFEQAEKLAKKGKAIDQYNLGLLYYKEKNIKEAFYWFEQAAKQGYANAQYNLGVIYDKQKDTQKSFYWYEKAANQGLSVAQFNLGLTYLDTKNKTENPEKAFYWMGKAANQGDLDAMNYLGLMYKKGYGVNQNYTKASEWYKKACQKGNSHGCENYKKLHN